MSAPRVFLVLCAMPRKDGDRMLLTAKGPGFTAGVLILDNR
jgi:hypothetical protein